MIFTLQLMEAKGSRELICLTHASHKCNVLVVEI